MYARLDKSRFLLTLFFRNDLMLLFNICLILFNIYARLDKSRFLLTLFFRNDLMLLFNRELMTAW